MCDQQHEPGVLILCEGGCRRAFHTCCLVPPLAQVPRGGHWVCPGCAQEPRVAKRAVTVALRRAASRKATQTVQSPTSTPVPVPIKRGRGRPRKTPLDAKTLDSVPVLLYRSYLVCALAVLGLPFLLDADANVLQRGGSVRTSPYIWDSMYIYTIFMLMPAVLRTAVMGTLRDP